MSGTSTATTTTVPTGTSTGTSTTTTQPAPCSAAGLGDHLALDVTKTSLASLIGSWYQVIANDPFLVDTYGRNGKMQVSWKDSASTALAFKRTQQLPDDSIETRDFVATVDASNPQRFTFVPNTDPVPDWMLNLANMTLLPLALNAFAGTHIPWIQQWDVAYVHTSPASQSTYAWFVLASPDRKFWTVLSRTPTLSCGDISLLQRALTCQGADWETKHVMPHVCQ